MSVVARLDPLLRFFSQTLTIAPARRSSLRRFAIATVVAGVLFSAPAAQGQTGDWVWEGGSNLATADPGVYGTRGVPAPGNSPGGRYNAASAVDDSGNFWLFGGLGPDSIQYAVNRNDLWEYSPATNEWTWWSGGDAEASGVYGTRGVTAIGNTPGIREKPIIWIDQGGNVWLFGGFGFDSNGMSGDLNDLWEFDVTTSEWVWMAGSSTVPSNGCQSGAYGTQGVASPRNIPGGRDGAIGWTGKNGNLWLFAGQGCDSTGAQGYLADLWEFDLASGDWIWISGADVGSGHGVFGTQGTPSSTTTPSARTYSANLGVDGSGNFWVFGGMGFDSVGQIGFLNDLWEFNPATKQWTWQSGSATVPGFQGSQPGVYGTQGQYAAGNVPAGRYGATGARDSKGNLWLFSGQNLSSTAQHRYYNDLWVFDMVSKEWAWISGADTLTCLDKSANASCQIIGATGSYGSLGLPAAANVPGGRWTTSGWVDTSGFFRIFGGIGIDSVGNALPLNDVWKYQPLAAVTSTTPAFGTMTFSPAATEQVGTNQAITIGDTLSYSGVQPTGAVTYVLNQMSYTARCIPSPGSQNGSPKICTAQVPAATIGELAVENYTVAGSLAADTNYSAATATSGTFSITAATSTSCAVPAPTSNTMNIAYFTLAESDLDGGTFPNGVSSNYVLPALGANGLPVYNTAATASNGAISAPKDLLADGEISWWSSALNNGGPNGTSDVIETSTGVVSLPYSNNAFFPPNGSGPNDSSGFQTAMLTGTLVAPASETVSFTIASDDMAFLYLDGQIACDDGGVHAPTSAPCTTSTIPAGTHTLALFYADLNPSGAALDFTVTTSNVGVGAGNQLVFGAMTFSPAAMELLGTSQAITISDTVTYSAAQPTGAVSFVLNGMSYGATCTTAGSQTSGQEVCSAVVPAATIAALPAAVYPVTSSFAGDCNYAAVAAPPGIFTIFQEQVTFGTMTFSPVATSLQGTSQTITISDTLNYPGPQPTGAVMYVLNGVSYNATCSTGGSPETCSATVPAATIAALPAASYTVTGSFAGDAVYAAATAASGTFTVTLPLPDFSIATGDPLALVTQHHGRTTISVTPINGFSGTVTLSCGTVPAYVTCEWGPATVDVSGGTASTELTIDTSGILNYLSAMHTADPPQRIGKGAGRFVFAGLAFPVLLFFGRRRKAIVRLMLCMLLFVSMLKLSGCSRYPDSTTPGTYGITIVGTSGAIQHSAVLTLVVTK